MSAVFAAGSVVVYNRLARMLGLDAWLSARPPAALARSGFRFWYYATTGEGLYPISIFFLLLAFVSAARIPPRLPPGRACRPPGGLGAAFCFHGTCLLALPGLVVMTWPEQGVPRRHRGVLVPR